MKLIDADWLLANLPDSLPYKSSVKRVLIQAPALEAAAHWIERAYEPLQCSNCGRRLRLFDEPENYCPRCGCYMKGE